MGCPTLQRFEAPRAPAGHCQVTHAQPERILGLGGSQWRMLVSPFALGARARQDFENSEGGKVAPPSQRRCVVVPVQGGREWSEARVSLWWGGRRVWAVRVRMESVFQGNYNPYII